ncbi:MAG: type II toxin-antitoxin system RelE/ParE family toxin [Acidobacteriota bacterium]
MRTIVFTPIARRELIDAHEWYENESPGLGLHFLTAADAAVNRIVANPLQFPLVHRTVRRALLRRFPYALMFVVESDESVTVIACFHGSRDPAQWQQRM